MAGSDCHLPYTMPRARKDTIQFVKGGYYHFYNRGARRLSIFRGENDYIFALQRIKEYVQKLQLRIIAYCLLPNHYHFLVQQKGEAVAGLLPQRVFNSYSKAYNRKYDHSGTLFERRYQAVHVVSDAHLRHLCRYIHANPVKHGIVEHIADWPYSNYPEWAGIRAGTLVDSCFIRDYFGDFANYEQFLSEYINASNE